MKTQSENKAVKAMQVKKSNLSVASLKSISVKGVGFGSNLRELRMMRSPLFTVKTLFLVIQDELSSISLLFRNPEISRGKKYPFHRNVDNHKGLSSYFCHANFQQTHTLMFKSIFSFFFVLLTSLTLWAGTPESPTLIQDDFCGRLIELVENAPSGFFGLRGSSNPSPKLPNSQEWFSETGFSGSSVSMISDVPEMGNYNYKATWSEGQNFDRAMQLEKAMIEKVKECLTQQGWTVNAVKLPGNANTQSHLFIISDAKEQKFNNVNVMVSFNDNGNYEISLKVTYSI